MTWQNQFFIGLISSVVNRWMRLAFINSTILLTACGPINTVQSDREVVTAILADIDNQTLTTDQQLENYDANAVILAPDQLEIRGRAALKDHLERFGSGVDISMRHEIVELTSFNDIVVAQGKVIGTAQPLDNPNIYPFETKNIILFKRDRDQSLKIWKVIYNSAPAED